MGQQPQALFLPGVITPAELAYGQLFDELGDGVTAVAKELEIYAEESPPDRSALEVEMEGILRTAADSGFERFHLVGFSGGGAASLAFTAEHPERLLSLALIEPAWAGNQGLDPAEAAVRREFERIATLPPEEAMPAFVRANLAPGIEPPPPPPGPVPDWMAKRPAGLRALTKAFREGDIDHAALGEFRAPVYCALGALSNPDYYENIAARLELVFPDFTIEVFEGCHHFEAPHRTEPVRLAASLRALWARAEAG